MTTATVGRVVTRPVRDADEQFRRELFAQARPDLAALPAGVRAQVLDLQWRAQARQYALDHPHARWEIVERDGVAVGQVVVDDACAAVRLVDIAVAEQHRGRGVARAVLADLLAFADATGRDVELHVWSHNHGARRLYERLGFAYLSTDDGGHLPMRRTRVERSEVAR